MALATISPQANGQASGRDFAQALFGQTQQLSAAINAAIQRGITSDQTRLSQEKDFLAEQQNNIGTEQAERFDLRDRRQFALEFARDLQQDAVREDQFSKTIGLDNKRVKISQQNADTATTNAETGRRSSDSIISSRATGDILDLEQASQRRQAFPQELKAATADADMRATEADRASEIEFLQNMATVGSPEEVAEAKRRLNILSQLEGGQQATRPRITSGDRQALFKARREKAEVETKIATAKADGDTQLANLLQAELVAITQNIGEMEALVGQSQGLPPADPRDPSYYKTLVPDINPARNP